MSNLKTKIFLFIKEKIDKKTIALIIIALSAFVFSLYLYGEKKDNTFQKDIIEDIYIDEEKDTEVFNKSQENEEGDITLLNNEEEIVVEIKGEVMKPDVYKLKEGAIVKDLIDQAGGVTEEAYLDNINRASLLKDNECVIILNKNNINETSEVIMDNSNLKESDGKININNATKDQLKTLPGIGDSRAEQIINYREEKGGFKSIEEIKNISGIGEKTFEKIKDSISS